MKFEAHITVTLKDAVRAQEKADLFKWKTSQIARDIILGEDTYFYLTAHSEDLPSILEDMKFVAKCLESEGVKIVRQKIEAIIFDTKEPKRRVR